MLKLTYSKKFYFGIGLIFLSFLMAKATTATFVFYFNDPVIRWSSVIVYFITWPILIIGAWWVGSEYYARVKKYISYKFYHESVKQQTKKVYHKTRSKTKDLHKKIKSKLQKKQ